MSVDHLAGESCGWHDRQRILGDLAVDSQTRKDRTAKDAKSATEKKPRKK